MNANDIMDTIEQHGWTIVSIKGFHTGVGSVEIAKPGMGCVVAYGKTASQALSMAVEQLLASEAA